MEDCCNLHDLCYDTCGKSKEECDSEFRTCLMDVCGSHPCIHAANLFADIVVFMGCPAYLGAQGDACTCG